MNTDARARALGRPAAMLDADAGLLRHLPPAVISLKEAQWDALLSEAELGAAMKRLERELAALDAQSGAGGSDIGRQLRPAAMSFAADGRKVARMLWQMAAFAPGSPSRLAPALAEFIDGLAATLEQAATWLRAGLTGPRPDLPEFDDTRWRMPGVPDPVEACFGVVSPELFDQAGQVSDARLLAHYRNRLPELSDTCHQLLCSITQEPLDLFAVVEPLLELLNIERPLLAWTCANQALALIRDAATADGSRTVDVFLQLRLRQASRAASRQRLAAARRAAESATTEADRALADLSAYRIMVEGQMRPWGWALLRLAGAQGDMPMVAELRDRLAAARRPLHAYVASALVPALRNADAHEEAHFDELQGKLAIGDEFVEPSRLRSSNAELAAIHAGLELALAAALEDVAPVADAYSVRPGDPVTAIEALAQAEQRFGHAGLRVWSLRRDRSTVQVRLDEIDPLRLSNPCFLATLQAHQLVAGVTRWQIGLREQEGWVIDLPDAVLRENWPVFAQAGHWFPEIPQETFLPCVTWARLAVELPGIALRAAAWLALNDLQHADEEAEAKRTADIPWMDIAWFPSPCPK